MKIEAHWSVIKRCYLHRFNHPRLDLLLWTLINEIIPAQKERLFQIVTGITEPWWWDDFKKAWNAAGTKDQSKNINTDGPNKGKRKRSINEKTTDLKSSYFTDINQWVCSCPAFLKSRFLVCKHLVQQVFIMPNGQRQRLIRDNFKRHTTPPFLVLKDYEVDKITPINSSIVPFEIETNINCKSHNIINIDEDLEEEARSYVESNWALFEQAIKRIEAEKSANNWRQVRAIMESSRLVQMEKKMQATERQRYQRATWTSATKKPYLMYLSYSDKLNDLKNKASSSESTPINNTDLTIEKKYHSA
ncbi:MULE transposase domain protein [Gigaspora margarita]|uniref:MULE transposase domain protein n=1 Tax=Gigaspora margarita TaxID=4874 RepID=A0A8H4B366_GIGMA|nr:MULE transposase domain protein [Gigaspora margarita]